MRQQRYGEWIIKMLRKIHCSSWQIWRYSPKPKTPPQVSHLFASMVCFASTPSLCLKRHKNVTRAVERMPDIMPVEAGALSPSHQEIIAFSIRTCPISELHANVQT